MYKTWACRFFMKKTCFTIENAIFVIIWVLMFCIGAHVLKQSPYVKCPTNLKFKKKIKTNILLKISKITQKRPKLVYSHGALIRELSNSRLLIRGFWPNQRVLKTVHKCWFSASFFVFCRFLQAQMTVDVVEHWFWINFSMFSIKKIDIFAWENKNF